jgi:bacillithiol biosynthesis deacetylase BshB1
LKQLYIILMIRQILLKRAMLFIKSEMKRAMIVSAHPDDAELAMGGTIAKMVESGWDVVIIDLTDGEPTPFGTKKLRKKEAKEASNILGIEKRMCLEMPNRYLQANLENRKKLAEQIRMNQPDLIFGPLVPDYHPDHIETEKLVQGARFEAKFHKTNMKGIPYWIHRRYGYYSTHRQDYSKPSFIVNVTKHWDIKIRAIKAYQSQIEYMSPVNNVSLLEKIEITCRYFGQSIGAKYGEPFFSYEPIAVENMEILPLFTLPKVEKGSLSF